MRFITLARKHKAKSFEIVCGPEAPIQDHFKLHREAVGQLPAHPEYAEVLVCQLVDAKPVLRFLTPEGAKAEKAQIAKDAETAKKSAEAAVDREKKRSDTVAAAEAKRRSATLEKINAQHDAIRARDAKPSSKESKE